MNFCILGAGAWGTTMAIHLSRFGHTVTLVPRRMEHAMEIATSRENKLYLPGYKLDNSVQIGCELRPALMESDVVLLACPSKYLRTLCKQVREHLDAARQLKMFITLCKGLEEGQNLKPCEVLAEEFPGYFHGALSGPTFAREVAAGAPTAIVFATNADKELTDWVQESISNQHLRVYTSTDVTGVELGACLKNVYAIAAGICDGLQLGDNAKAALITRVLAEMVRLGACLGGRTETFYGLSGIGDLVATCNGKWSRNRTFGEKLAGGDSAESLINDRKMTVEGFRTTACFYELCKAHKLDAPILNQIYATLYEGKKPLEALESLMSRDLKAE